MPAPDEAVPPVVGGDLRVPLVTGERVTYANLDHAASAPALVAVRDAVERFLPYYASVHRGAGYASQVSTRAYEQSRDVVRRFVGGRPDDAVVFTRNTTDALNLLEHCLPAGTHVVAFDTEHHADLLPWRRRPFTQLIAPTSAADAVAKVGLALGTLAGPALVCVTGASNVTGELWPVAEIARVARRYGARVLLDAAQLLPHRDVDIAALGVDYVAFSGHKLYAPYGAGALVGRADWLTGAEPFLAGGGASRSVEPGAVHWQDSPERQEAGSPNVVGAYALATACRTLEAAGRDRLARHEAGLTARLREGLARVPGVALLSLFGEDVPRVGTVAFAVRGWDAGKLAAVLSAEYGIGVRDGLFCAHLLTRRLLRRADSGGSAVRASLGLGTTAEHVDRLVRAVAEVVGRGPSREYERRDGRWAPVRDPRIIPDLWTA
ncbi:MAG: aminotransferase class V-fold PLP-dependent enzyme [Streptosporangiales bacterium]|nr:aminotransferase class V-fold PLP-dependent enzyme [Streptosporangiales bacterium]MBO0890939.1 aminotransferase class V-fold PLP-dependent enzyme [Acidothermales bacterium]